jgi:hypothetical protein
MKQHPELNELWVEQRIVEDPTILGLGDLILKDRQRIQPRAGRLDLLLQDEDSTKRFEVEIQLGKTDESHIMRTIEYWDIERKRYPQYDHAAVIVAEEITSRFLNVISLFNGSIPLIAIQMRAFQIEDKVSLTFITVLDEQSRGLVDDDEEVQEQADRPYWEKRANKATVDMAAEVVSWVREWDPTIEAKYNKFYIGLAKDGKPFNFMIFRPKKATLRLELSLTRSDETQERLEHEGLDLMDYDARSGTYRIRVTPFEFNEHRMFLQQLVRDAWEVAIGG